MPKTLEIGYVWFREIDRVYESDNNTYCIMLKDINICWGMITHEYMQNKGRQTSSYKGVDIYWAEKQNK